MDNNEVVPADTTPPKPPPPPAPEHPKAPVKKAPAKKKASKKKASKKKASKKKARKKPEPKPAEPGVYSFDILDSANSGLVEDTQEALSTIRARRKNQPTGFKSMSAIRHASIPVRELLMQWGIGSFGIHERTLTEIIGGEGLGKTTLVHWLAGNAMAAGIPVMYQETEGKPLEREWALRALSPNRKLAKIMLDRMAVYERVFELNQMDRNMMDWLNVMRGRTKVADFTPVPIDTPLMVIIDTWSKLMSPGEAAGVYDHADLMSEKNRKKKKDTNEASNLGHSKWAHAWCRRLPNILHSYNVNLILVQHQNEKVDMSGGGGPKLAADISALYNKAKLGGNATNQNAALQLILAYGGMAKDGANDKIGKFIKMRTEKNSYGPENRVIRYMLQNEKMVDGEEYHAPALRFDEDTALFMADRKLLGTTVNKKRYTCPALGVEGVTSMEFKEALDGCQEAREELGRILEINGYDDTVDKIIAEAADAADSTPDE